MNETVIGWRKNKQSLSQALSSGMEFCLLSADMHQCHDMAYCKDYLQDVVFGSVNNKVSGIYGLNFNPKSDPAPDMTCIKIAIGSSADHNFSQKIENMTDFLHQIEEKLEMKKTFFLKAQNPAAKYAHSGVYVAVGDRRWITCPVMVSFYSLMLRVGASHAIGQAFMKTLEEIGANKKVSYQPVDNSYIATALPGIKKIIKERDEKIFGLDLAKNYRSNLNIGTMHGVLGICGFSRKSTETYFPEWHKGD